MRARRSERGTDPTGAAGRAEKEAGRETKKESGARRERGSARVAPKGGEG